MTQYPVTDDLCLALLHDAVALQVTTEPPTLIPTPVPTPFPDVAELEAVVTPVPRGAGVKPTG